MFKLGCSEEMLSLPSWCRWFSFANACHSSNNICPKDTPRNNRYAIFLSDMDQRHKGPASFHKYVWIRLALLWICQYSLWISTPFCHNCLQFTLIRYYQSITITGLVLCHQMHHFNVTQLHSPRDATVPTVSDNLSGKDWQSIQPVADSTSCTVCRRRPMFMANGSCDHIYINQGVHIGLLASTYKLSRQHRHDGLAMHCNSNRHRFKTNCEQEPRDFRFVCSEMLIRVRHCL